MIKLINIVKPSGKVVPTLVDSKDHPEHFSDIETPVIEEAVVEEVKEEVKPEGKIKSAIKSAKKKISKKA